MEDKIDKLIELTKELASKVEHLEHKASFQDAEIDRLNKICRNIKTI